jgi:hypothetical protein
LKTPATLGRNAMQPRGAHPENATDHSSRGKTERHRQQE